MSERELTGYALLIGMLLVFAWQMLRWRRQILRNRMKRWGTRLSPSKFMRRRRT